MADLNIVKVNALPLEPAAHTLYLVKNAQSDLLELHMTGATGAEIRHIPTKDEITSDIMHFGSEPPALPSAKKLWWNVVEGSLYVQYTDVESTHWVEAMPSISVPDFAGSGESNTMARSDHHHDDRYAMIGNHEW